MLVLLILLATYIIVMYWKLSQCNLWRHITTAVWRFLLTILVKFSAQVVAALISHWAETVRMNERAIVAISSDFIFGTLVNIVAVFYSSVSLGCRSSLSQVAQYEDLHQSSILKYSLIQHYNVIHSSWAAYCTCERRQRATGSSELFYQPNCIVKNNNIINRGWGIPMQPTLA